MWEGVTFVKKCDSPKEFCQLGGGGGGVMVMGRSKRA